MKLKCLISVPDKNTGKQYKAGETYEFEEARAKEVLAARTRVTKEPYFELVVETVENNVEEILIVDNDLAEKMGEDLKDIKHIHLEDMTVKELKELASDMNVEGYNKMKKAELIEAIKNNG